MMPTSLRAEDPLNSSGVEIDILKIKDEWAAIDVTYMQQRAAIKAMHEKHGTDVDLWIHLGRQSEDFYTCERRAFRQDFTCSWLGEPDQKGYYGRPDNVKQNVDDIGPNPWLAVPLGLNTEVHVTRTVAKADEVYKRSYGSTSNTANEPQFLPDIRSHVEAASMACGFVFYESLAHCWVAGRKRHVLFCHVPREVDESSITRGTHAVLAIIGAAIADIIESAKPRADGGRAEWAIRFMNEP